VHASKGRSCIQPDEEAKVERKLSDTGKKLRGDGGGTTIGGRFARRLQSVLVAFAVLLAVLALAACGEGGNGDERAAPTAEEATTETAETTTDTTTTEPPVDPEVRRWVRRWQKEFAAPQRRHARAMLRFAVPAVEGNPGADFRLINALNGTGRCQSALARLEPTPPDLFRVRALSNQVCLNLFRAGNRLADALNASDTDQARRALEPVRSALRRLENAQNAARAASTG
jgi:hypothetical protein